jgi:hypothetical protein
VIDPLQRVGVQRRTGAPAGLLGRAPDLDLSRVARGRRKLLPLSAVQAIDGHPARPSLIDPGMRGPSQRLGVLPCCPGVAIGQGHQEEREIHRLQAICCNAWSAPERIRTSDLRFRRGQIWALRSPKSRQKFRIAATIHRVAQLAGRAAWDAYSYHALRNGCRGLPPVPNRAVFAALRFATGCHWLRPLGSINAPYRTSPRLAVDHRRRKGSKGDDARSIRCTCWRSDSSGPRLRRRTHLDQYGRNLRR